MVEGSTLLTIYITVSNLFYAACTFSPNISKEGKGRKVDDRIGLGIPKSKIFFYISLSLNALHTVYYAYLIQHFPKSSYLCPQRDFVRIANPTVFTWNNALVALLTLNILAGFIRIAAFRNLGQNFTFSLREPDGLVTSGIHKFMQHPSYTGLIPMTMVMMWIYFRFDGYAACWIPGRFLKPLIGVQYYLMAFLGTVFVVGSWARVADEEKMLKRVFGKQWIDYHTRTARFIPGVF